MSNEGKIVGSEKAFREAEKQIKELDKTFEPPEKTLFERNREALDKAEKDGKTGG